MAKIDISNKVEVENLLKLVDTRLKAKDIKSWESDILEQSKLHTYRLFKVSYGVEPYVKMYSV